MQQPLANERWAKVIPRQVISRAYEGSSDDLWNIQFSLNPENCSIDVTNVALKHLTTYDSILPIELELETREGPSKLRRMIPCISILSTAIVVAKGKTQLKKVLVERLSNRDAVDAVCRWATFCLFTNGPEGLLRGASNKYVVSYETIAQSSRAISTLLHLDASLPQHFLSSTDFMDFVIHAWMDTLELSNELFIDLDDPFMELCPVLRMLQTCLSIEDSRRALLDRLEVNGHLHALPSSFIRRAQQLSVERDSRAQQLGLAENSPGTVHHRTADYFFELLDTLHQFLTHFPSLRQPFLAAKYMGELLKALEATLARVETTQAGVPRQYLKPLSSLLVHAAEQSTRGVLYWRDLVSAGLIPLLGRALVPVTKSETQPRIIGAQLTETLSLFTIYPAVLKIICATDSSVMSKGMDGYDQLSNVWEALRYRCLDAGRVFRATEGMSPTCDNIQCTRLAGSDFIPKQCSGCSSVVYCSADCQKSDWEQFHRGECCHAREDYYNRKSTASLYSHSTRKFHAKWIEKEFNEPLNASVVRSMARDHRSHAAHEVLPMFFYTAAQQDMNVITLRDKAWWTAKAHWPFTQDHLKPRVTTLVDQYTSGTFPEDIRLVEGVFHFAMEKMVYLTVMLKKKGKKYESVWSLAKHAHCVRTP